MIEPTTLLAFTLLNMSFALIPGPDVVCILTNSVSRGTAAGAKVCLGIACGALAHVAAASLGLTAFLAAVPTAFLAVKAVGAVYLVWLGWQMLRHPVAVGVEPHASRWSSPFAQGALSSLPINAATISLGLTYTLLAQRHGLLVSYGFAALVWIVIAAIVGSMQWSLWGGLLVNALAFAICTPLMHRYRHAKMPPVARRWCCARRSA